MKPIALHPVSVLAGLALAGLAFLAAGAAQTPIPTRTVFVGEVPAEWWTYVELETVLGVHTRTYTVPAGRNFVATAVDVPWRVYADGQPQEPRLLPITSYGGGPTIANGTRVPFGPGTLLTAAQDNCPSCSVTSRLWGYLAPAH